MYLQLEDQGAVQIFVPGKNNPGYMVPVSFFDNLSDYEFSQTFAELLAFNPSMDLRSIITERDKRRFTKGLPATNYQPLLESKFGDWIARTGKKIEQFFKPTEKTTPVSVTTPDGQEIIVQAPIKQDSMFTGIVKGVAKAFGFYNEPVPIQPQQPSVLRQIIPLLAIGTAGFIAYKLIVKKK